MQIREVCVRYRKSDIPLERGEQFQSSGQVFKAFRSQALDRGRSFVASTNDRQLRALRDPRDTIQEL